MNIGEKIPCRMGEQVSFFLRGLYRQYGYQQYRVGKFEEYDLYARNKNFLVSDQLLTFTDTNGKLMALKPDVTLSILKNANGADGLQKVFYQENVYRPATDSNGFCEIMQAGLECIGELDTYSVGEVVLLAQESLEQISGEYLLDISHLGFVQGLMDALGIDQSVRQDILREMGRKNFPAIREICDREKCESDELCRLTGLFCPLEEGVSVCEGMTRNDTMRSAVAELRELCGMLRVSGKGEKRFLDFSIVNDMSYYSGIIFRGFVRGLPKGVLSGGRYDPLLRRMGKSGGGIGFAVYLDQLERLDSTERSYDADVLLLYSQKDSPADVLREVQRLQDSGKTVRVSTVRECGAYCREIRSLKGGVSDGTDD